MRRFIQIALVFSVFFWPLADGRTVPKQTFEEIVKRSDLIVLASVREGMIIGQNEDVRVTPGLRFCVEVGTVQFGEAGADPLCFHANRGLTVKGRYLLFLLSDETDDQSQASSSYFLLAGLEALSPSPYHAVEAVRGEAVQHPRVPGVGVEGASRRDEGEARRPAIGVCGDGPEGGDTRSVTVYSYLSLADVQRAIRSTLDIASDQR